MEQIDGVQKRLRDAQRPAQHAARRIRGCKRSAPTAPDQSPKAAARRHRRLRCSTSMSDRDPRAPAAGTPALISTDRLASTAVSVSRAYRRHPQPDYHQSRKPTQECPRSPPTDATACRRAAGQIEMRRGLQPNIATCKYVI